MVVRNSPSGRYRIIGECYFNEIVNGEAFLGPLPAHYKVIKKPMQIPDWQPSLWLDCYRDTRTGVDRGDDPRFDPARHRLLNGAHDIHTAKVCKFCLSLHTFFFYCLHDVLPLAGCADVQIFRP